MNIKSTNISISSADKKGQLRTLSLANNNSSSSNTEALCCVEILQFATRLTATGTHMPYGITQCYLPPGRADIPALTPPEAGTRSSDPGGIQG